MQIALVVPPTLGDDEEERVEFLGLGYVAAVARQAGYAVEVLDCRFQGLDHASAIAAIERLDPQIVGITTPFALDLISAVKLATQLRHEGFEGLIVIGGHPATFTFHSVLEKFQAVDIVVRGEGERTFLELLRSLVRGEDWQQLPGIAYRHNGQVEVTAPRPLLADLDALPFPARDNVATHGAPASVVWFRQHGLVPGTVILSSRGCPFRCTFCSVSVFYGSSPGRRWRPRSPMNVVQEIEELVIHWGIRSLRFSDDNFFGSCRQGRDRARELALLLIKRDLGIEFVIECCAHDIEPALFGLLKQAGLVRVNVGVESGVPRMLKDFKKRATVEDNERAIAILRDMGIDLHPNFILIDPDTTIEELRENLEFFKRTRIYRAPSAFQILYTNRVGLFAGTAILERYHGERRTRPWRFAGITAEDQALAEQIGAVFDYTFKDPRIVRFLRLHIPVINELIGRERMLRRCIEKIQQKPGAETMVSAFNRWHANVNTLALRVYEQAIEACEKENVPDPYLEQLREDLISQLDWYDRLHFGKTLKDVAGSLLGDATNVQSIQTANSSPGVSL
ncbi:MAG: radical SAM protein [Armatimonadota bacterium]|nr:radical SAM protein [Armatimonadota bacterium]